MNIDRRTLLRSATALSALTPLIVLERAVAARDLAAETACAGLAHERLSNMSGMKMHGDEQVVMPT